MLEYFSYKKYKKNKEEKDAGKESPKKEEHATKDVNKEEAKKDENHESSAPEVPAKAVLKPEDERFLEELLAQSNDGPPPPLPPRIYTYDVDWHSDTEVSDVESKKTTDDERDEPGKGKATAKKEDETDKAKDKEEKKPSRLSLLFTRNKKPAETLKASTTLQPDNAEAVPPKEVEREKKDLTRVLDRLNLSARNNNAVSAADAGSDSSDLLQRFTQVFRDLVSGVPTAYDDLTKLMEDRDGTISKLFDKLPSSLKKLVTQMPDKLTTTLAPELLAAAAEAQGIKVGQGGMKGAAKRMLMGKNLANLIKTPGAIVGMLRAIVEVLKSRWPAFIGMNVIWSVALSLLLLVLWYCYKRGREERILREEADSGAEASSRRYEELSDDEEAGENDKPATEAAEAAAAIPVIITSPEGELFATEVPKDAATPDVEVPPSDAPAEQTRS
ncbi:hypothetical protein BBK36DRAFT_22429 [Trichoderma citrinoviride]|uniref:Ring-like domain-containing protein n=1 Tax=Trichoderma citrinoviride TaxID=58853 RepID=A0A2T4B3M5_9HYPO|nr:hypothetical protein BBK36DRAFT_22429 [Trichoderma citrinoviride]PTB63935.1 hypothetical protein BBK36DRAFT_22429 [Trichoderma citrinoviride]